MSIETLTFAATKAAASVDPTNSTRSEPGFVFEQCSDMDGNIKFLVLLVIPIVLGGVLVCSLQSKNSDYMWHMLLAWGILVVAVVVPFWVLDTAQGAQEALCSALSDSVDRAAESIKFVFSMITPLLLLPIGVFLIKLAATSGAESNGQGDRQEGVSTKGAHDSSRQAIEQAHLVTFIIKVVMGVYIVFGVVSRCGISLDGVIDLATVMSLGISWSMRDWLTSAWAGLVLACCTRLCTGCSVSVGITSPSTESGALKMTVLGSPSGHVFYVPNSVFMQSGFTWHDMVKEPK